jgi:hypothetical protein
MKKILVAVACAAALVAVAQSTNPVPLRIVWEYPNPDQGTDFRVYTSKVLSDPTIPGPDWKLLGITNGLQLPFEAVPGVAFYVVSASNLWGGPVFSDAVSTPPPLDNSGKLRIERR